MLPLDNSRKSVILSTKFSGEEIKSILNIREGKVIGHIKEEICRLQFLNKLSHKEQAEDWIISNFT